MKTIIVLFLILFIVIFAVASAVKGGNTLFSQKQSTVTIGKSSFVVELEKTPAQQEKGLSGRSSLAAGHGMLFLFTTPGRYAFWMKDMKFPIDIVYISGSQVVDVFSNVPQPLASLPDSSLPVYTPRAAADKVLELNAGVAKKDGIIIGDTVTTSL